METLVLEILPPGVRTLGGKIVMSINVGSDSDSLLCALHFYESIGWTYQKSYLPSYMESPVKMYVPRKLDRNNSYGL